MRQLVSLRQTVDKSAAQIVELGQRTHDVDERLGKLETVILADPQKALELPLLRREVDSIREQLSRDVDALRAESARGFDLMKWVIGLMALVSLSLVGTAMSNVFRREAATSSQDAKTDASTKLSHVSVEGQRSPKTPLQPADTDGDTSVLG